jgi:hypothetical protein
MKGPMFTEKKIKAFMLAAMIIGLLCLATFAQDLDLSGGPDPLTVDEFTELPCEEFLGRLDNFFLTINQNPDMIGITFISVDPTKKYKSVNAEQIINNYVNYRKFPANRIKIVRTNSDEDMYFRLWVWDPNAASPELGEIDNTLILPQNLTEPFLLSTEDEFGTCPSGDPRKLFADFLNANLTARGKIVIRERSAKKGTGLSTKIRDDLSKTYGISSDRLSVTNESGSPGSSPKVEYWYLP